MVDIVMIAVIVAFFVAVALLVRVLGRVTEAASVEREPELADGAEVSESQRHTSLADGRK